jgi:hypothetical protein
MSQKGFCASKDTIEKVKNTTHRMGEKILVKHVFLKELVSRIHIKKLIIKDGKPN